MKSLALVFAIRIFHVQPIKENEGSSKQKEAAEGRAYKNWFMPHKSDPQRRRSLSVCVGKMLKQNISIASQTLGGKVSEQLSYVAQLKWD